LATVADGHGNTATYNYLANSPLVSQIAFQQNGATRVTTTKTYDDLNRLTQIASQPAAAGLPPVAFNYSYNSANQRTHDQLADGPYWVYDYDSLGQVIRACLQIPRDAVFEQSDGWRGATRANPLCGASPKEQRSQPAVCSKTLRAADLLAVGGVGSVVTARSGDAPPSPPCPQPKSLAAAPLAILRQALSGHKYFRDGTPVPGQQFDYGFDTIGNRIQTRAGGDQTGGNQRLANYSVNSLNQIISRDFPGTNDIVGVALATNSVTLNGQPAWHKWEYFWGTVTTNNTAAPAWLTATVASGGASNTGSVYLARTPEQFSYDADGNLTNDGRWAYTWDAENRLIGMTVNTAAGPQYQLTFAYDPKGRRIQKTVSTNGISSTINFLYDGWNLVGILNSQSTLVQSFMWGIDLSGSLQGAGGVGGLLEVSSYGASTTNSFTVFDGNGNIAALVDAANGTGLASYEYGPFGEVIRATGPMSKTNPMRFSTKYQDDESDLLYYGYRYYKPSTGVWLSCDPMGLEPFRSSIEGDSDNGSDGIDDIAAYAFVLNNPIGATDWLGLLSSFKNCSCCQIDALRNHAVLALNEAESLKSQINTAIAQVHQNPGQYPWHTEYKLHRAFDHLNKAEVKIVTASVVCNPSTTRHAIAESRPYGNTITVYDIYWWYVDLIQNATLDHEATHMASATTDAAYFWQNGQYPHDTFGVPWPSIASTYDSWIIESFVIPRDNLGPATIPWPRRLVKECL